MNSSVEVETKVQQLGSRIILNCLVKEGVEVVFGYPGGCVIPLFDELLNFPELKFFLVRHEQAATHAADGLARVTGKAQVVFATSGPGATNCITGLATAMMDSVPMVCITGQVRREVIGSDAFQETNVVGVSRPVTKHNYLVKDIKDLQYTVREAFYIANHGRKGPVLIDIPVDVQKETYNYELNPDPIVIRGFTNTQMIDQDLVKKAWSMLKAASKPIIYAGGGINASNAASELYALATAAKIPVATTLLGQGTFPVGHALSLGMLGMHGTYTANIAMTECDLCLVLGARFDDRVTGDVDKFLEQAKIIHVDIDPRSLNKIKTVDLPIRGNVKDFLSQLNLLAGPLKTDPWVESLKASKIKHPPPRYYDYDSVEDKIRPEYILKVLSDKTNGKAYIVTDVGQHQMFTSLHYAFQYPRTHITSGGLGTMGFSLPAAMGIATSVTDKPIISISGDGGFQMCMQELATIRAYNLPVKIVIFNNSNLGMVKQWQDFFWKSRYASTVFDFNPDFSALTYAYDIPSKKVRTKQEVEAVVDWMLKEAGPVLVEFKIDPDAHVYPMVPAGRPLAEIIRGEDPF